MMNLSDSDDHTAAGHSSPPPADPTQLYDLLLEAQKLSQQQTLTLKSVNQEIKKAERRLSELTAISDDHTAALSGVDCANRHTEAEGELAEFVLSKLQQKYDDLQALYTKSLQDIGRCEVVRGLSNTAPLMKNNVNTRKTIACGTNTPALTKLWLYGKYPSTVNGNADFDNNESTPAACDTTPNRTAASKQLVQEEEEMTTLCAFFSASGIVPFDVSQANLEDDFSDRAIFTDDVLCRWFVQCTEDAAQICDLIARCKHKSDEVAHCMAQKEEAARQHRIKMQKKLEFDQLAEEEATYAAEVAAVKLQQRGGTLHHQSAFSTQNVFTTGSKRYRDVPAGLKRDSHGMVRPPDDQSFQRNKNNWQQISGGYVTYHSDQYSKAAGYAQSTVSSSHSAGSNHCHGISRRPKDNVVMATNNVHAGYYRQRNSKCPSASTVDSAHNRRRRQQHLTTGFISASELTNFK